MAFRAFQSAQVCSPLSPSVRQNFLAVLTESAHTSTRRDLICGLSIRLFWVRWTGYWACIKSKCQRNEPTVKLGRRQSLNVYVS